ncbi:SufBD protein [Oscillospiraceae bacterium MB08-C2-2]|nr:SufBD protein [Oscillospiraceae bacterium MB08-C2-2]
MDDVEGAVIGLTDRNPNTGHDCLKSLLEASRLGDSVYPYFQRFAEMLESENSYIRTRGLLLIAANARWDQEYQLDEIIDSCLRHIMDEKPTVSRQFIAALPEMALYKPKLAGDICDALRKARPSRYKASMAPLIRQDIAAALEKIAEQTGEPL